MRVSVIASLLLVLLLLISCLEIRVTGDPERPLPIAAMGVTVEKHQDGTALVAEHNPQLGGPPVPDTYQDDGGGIWGSVLSIAGKFATGDYLGAAGGLAAALAGGYAVQQRRKAKKLALLPPEEAAKEL